MAIDWNTVPDAYDVGEEILALMGELFPIPRSLTGDGVRETLAVLARETPLEILETPSGAPVFDWTVPREWSLRGAWIEGPDGKRIVDTADSPLHVLGYSLPVDTVVDLGELRDHVFTHADDPELIPYRTSYWKEQWGFCMSSAPARLARRRELPRRRRRDARRRLADVGRGELPGRDRVRVPPDHARVPPGARERQPLRRRALVGDRTDACPPTAPLHVPLALEPGDARTALLARS